MAWLDQGVTNKRKLLDQSATVTWAGSQVRVPFNKIQSSGYLRKLRLWMPAFTGTTTLGGGTFLQQSAQQLGALRGIANIYFKMQGIAALYDLSGPSFYALQYLMNGRKIGRPGGAPGQNRVSLNATSVPPNGGTGVGNYVSETVLSGNNPLYSLFLDIPLTEFITFHDVAIPQANGQVAVVATKTVEVGLITNQNVNSNINFGLLLNPLYSTGTDSAYVVTGAATSTGTPTFNLSAEVYDVPDNVTDRPLALQQSLVVTRSESRWQVSGGAVTIRHDSAGKLMTLSYLCYDSNDNLVDLASVCATATIQFIWGNTVHKTDQYLCENLADAINAYGVAPPTGMFFLDYFEDGSYTDMIDTDDLTNVRTILAGFTGVDHIVVVEERLIGVKAG